MRSLALMAAVVIFIVPGSFARAEVVSTVTLWVNVVSIAPEKITIDWQGKRVDLPRSIVKSNRILTGKPTAVIVDGRRFQDWYYERLFSAASARDARASSGNSRHTTN